MKNLLLLVLLLFIFGCEHEDQLQDRMKIDFDLASTDDLQLGIEQNLSTIGYGILGLSQDNSFRKMVYSEIDESFTGDFEALIEYLLLKNPGYATSFDDNVVKYNGSNFADVTNSIVQSIDLQVHPQIFIPNYDVLKEQNILGKNNPVVIFYAGDESITEFPGYKISENGIIKTKTQVDEDFSLKNEVWVISINERYFGSIADIDMNKEKARSQRVKGQGDLYAYQVVVKQHFESWAAGASEVHIRKFVDASQQLLPTQIEVKYQQYRGPFEGDRIVKASRKDVRKQNVLTPNMPMVINWEIEYSDRPRMIFAIFEYDVAPTGLKSYWYNDGYGNSLEVKYRSADYAYYEGSFLNWNLPTTIANNNIEVNFTYTYN